MLCKDSFVSKCDCQHSVDTLLSSMVASFRLTGSSAWHSAL